MAGQGATARPVVVGHGALSGCGPRILQAGLPFLRDGLTASLKGAGRQVRHAHSLPVTGRCSLRVSARVLRGWELLARILHQAACRVDECLLISLTSIAFLGFPSRYKPRWPRPRWSFARVRAHAPSTIATAMIPVASTRTRAKSCAIIAALGAICGLGGSAVLSEFGPADYEVVHFVRPVGQP